MPYIAEDRRTHLVSEQPQNVGELNYAFTMLMIGYLARKGLSYDTINAISGAATEALAEFRRRVTVPYEISKIAKNGDVYPYDHGSRYP